MGVGSPCHPRRAPGFWKLVEQPELVSPILERPFSLGELVQSIRNTPVGLTVDLETFIAKVSSKATQHVEASFGEGYWVDHWFYNLDLIDTYLAVYPDRETELLMGESRVPYYDSAAAVPPRWRRYVRTHDGRVRQYGAVHEADGEKLALIDSRTEQPRLMRTAHGRGEVYRTTVLAKLVGLAVVKFSTLDPGGMGIENGSRQAWLVRRPQWSAGVVWLLHVRDVRASSAADLPDRRHEFPARCGTDAAHRASAAPGAGPAGAVRMD